MTAKPLYMLTSL